MHHVISLKKMHGIISNNTYIDNYFEFDVLSCMVKNIQQFLNKIKQNNNLKITFIITYFYLLNEFFFIF